MKIYISGPITGYCNNNEPAFNRVATTLRLLGHIVLNPFDLDLTEGKRDNWVGYMKRDIKAMMGCDAIFPLSGWEHSKGASLEMELAKALKMPVYRLEDDVLVEVK